MLFSDPSLVYVSQWYQNKPTQATAIAVQIRTGRTIGNINAAMVAAGVPSPVPTVTNVNPTSGPTAGGTSVTITGTNLSGATSVHFGATAGAITSNSATQVVATSPAGGAGTGYSVWQYRLSLTSGNQWRGTVFVGASAFTVTALAIATTAWTYLVFTRTGNTMQLYVNGSLAASATVTGTTNTNTRILAIRRTGASSTDYFNGAIDEVALYPTALSASRVAAHFAAGSAPPGP